MDQIVEHLLSKLSDKGLPLVEISRLVRDVFNIVEEGGEFTVEAVNKRLERLGWEGQMMDDFTFDLFMFLLECGDDYEVVRHTLH
jgi:hypothetical protein